MYNKIKVLVTFILLFSLQAFSQSTEKSAHPLLDKYYPQKQNPDTSKAVTTQIKQEPAPAVKTTTVPVATTTPVVSAPVVQTPPPVTTKTVPAVTNTSAVTNAPGMTTTAVPTMTSAPAVTATFADTTTTVPAVTNTSAVTTTPLATTTPINKPTTVTTQAPVQKVKQPAAPMYMETRLGSSTKQYDTWEKNNNGAGSVTTSPK